MIDKIRGKVLALYLLVTQSIAFYPTLIAIFFFFLGIFMTAVEDDQLTEFVADNASFLVIQNADTARSILSAIIGGLFSLTVFSFSMVMVILNQASSNFSPRLLPGLISDKKNQWVLGIYLGSILYNIIVLISIQPTKTSQVIDGFSILLGIAFTILSLAMFVFFIHSISTNIRIEKILGAIYRDTKYRLTKLKENDRQQTDKYKEDLSDWQMLTAGKTGYFQGADLQSLKQLVEDAGSSVQILVKKGTYVQNDTRIAAFSREVDQKYKDRLQTLLVYNDSNNIRKNYVLGIQQITEVGIKAMSPGINDPGTAIITIDYLTELLALRMQIDDYEKYTCGDGHILELATASFEQVLYDTMAAYRQYCKHDILLNKKLFNMLKYLQGISAAEETYHDLIAEEIEMLREDFKKNIDNDRDINLLEKRI